MAHKVRILNLPLSTKQSNLNCTPTTAAKGFAAPRNKQPLLGSAGPASHCLGGGVARPPRAAWISVALGFRFRSARATPRGRLGAVASFAGDFRGAADRLRRHLSAARGARAAERQLDGPRGPLDDWRVAG